VNGCLVNRETLEVPAPKSRAVPDSRLNSLPDEPRAGASAGGDMMMWRVILFSVGLREVLIDLVSLISDSNNLKTKTRVGKKRRITRSPKPQVTGESRQETTINDWHHQKKKLTGKDPWTRRATMPGTKRSLVSH
jgi:hypothetical protein